MIGKDEMLQGGADETINSGFFPIIWENWKRTGFV
jgi:hypothetical protein